MFTDWANTHDLVSCLTPAVSYHPWPTISQRQAWHNLPADLRESWIGQAETYRGFSYPPLTASAFMAYERTGDRQIYEEPHYARRYALTALILGECMEDKGRFLDDIINGIWALCEESFWGISAHNGIRHNSGIPLPDVENPYIDLFAAETAGLLAHGVYLLRDRLDAVTPLICRRVDRELERRIRLPFLNREDYWWMGFWKEVNNWDPWIVSNVMSVFLLTEHDSHRRAEAVYKMLECLDHFLATYHEDGGCDEGTSYWNYAGGSLFDCMDQLVRASGGAVNFFEHPLIQNIGRFLYRSFIHERYFINFADGGAKVSIDRNMIWRYGKRIGDENLTALALSSPVSFDPPDIPRALRRILPELFTAAEFSSETAQPPYVRDGWMDGIQVMAARQCAGSCQGLYLAAKGGHNDESHNHNDVGSFLLYCDGIPAVMDVGVETYTKATFSEERYTIWTMQSQYHNLPTINGCQQLPGRDKSASHVSYQCRDEQVDFSLEMASAYPREAGADSYVRSYCFRRGEKPSVSITDRYVLQRRENHLELHFMTWGQPRQESIGILSIPVGPGESVSDTVSAQTSASDWNSIGTGTSSHRRLLLSYDASVFSVSMEEIPITDARLLPVWGQRIHRITLSGSVDACGEVSVTWRMDEPISF